jgi:hypothetical protein
MKAEAVTDIADRRDITARSWQLSATVFAIHVVIALAVWVESWDDGFITLAFARTFAETGHIGLTPISEQVEGATSPLWFLLMAGVYSAGLKSFAVFHFGSQLATALCSAAAAAVFYRLIRPSAPGAAWWITLLVFLLGPVRSETGYGMEMSLLCLVVLGVMALLRKGDGWKAVAALAALVPWIRLEATGYVLAGVLTVWVFSASRVRRMLVAVFAASLASVCVLVLVRYMVFGTVLFPNTMIAKQMTPYSPPFPSAAWFYQQLIGLVAEPLVVALPAVVVFLVLLRLSAQSLRDKIARLKSRAAARDVPLLVSFGLGYAAAFFIVTAVVGGNTFAPPGRMGLSALMVLVVAAVNSVSLPDGADRRLPVRSRLAVAGLFLVPFVGLIALDTIGIAYRAAQLVSDSPERTVKSWSVFHANGEAMERVRTLLGLPRLTVLLADVGQAGLCCQNLEILDLGLLANSELTRTGWSGFPAYLRSKRPDLIQLHSSFTQESGITHDEFFKENYVPIFVDLSSFYLRNDHYESLRGSCHFGAAPKYYFFNRGELTSQKNMPADSAMRIDKEYLDSLQLTQFCHLGDSKTS